ncbi:acetate/propionate family kinase [Salinibius halmophilus]|uniref:acetate/propionate family kinase n=1 Tax=Salinibius halmophilus TaxID=1853216 RepID=UPI000E671D19|nr:acetate kinase [Salinibius halmophilus]
MSVANIAEAVLVLNSGSSSLKTALFVNREDQPIATCLAERLGTAEAVLHWSNEAGKTTYELTDGSMAEALAKVVELVEAALGSLAPLVAVGHRVVHGGESFGKATLVDEEVAAEIARLSALAPLHNPANLAGIHAMRDRCPAVPQIAVFDTAFHQTLPEHAYLYPVPKTLYQAHKVRRYGFHGTSHQFVSREAVKVASLPADDHGLIVAHLGNGCSATAVVNGESRDTTMGLTPLEGLMMGTRSGDVDPGLLSFLADQTGKTLDEITSMLNKESGLLGLSGLSNDMRTVSEAAEQGNQNAQIALDVFCYRLARQIMALTAALPKLDALVFTGGIGENSRLVRKRVTEHLRVLKIEIADERNADNGKSSNHVISPEDAAVKVMVVNTNEEWEIANQSLALLEK